MSLGRNRPRRFGTRSAYEHRPWNVGGLAGGARDPGWRTSTQDEPHHTIGPDRRLALIRSNLHLAKLVADASDATVNDVLIAAYRRWLAGSALKPGRTRR
jgi:hypothetical protein